jgi:hypothetical protein
VATYTPAVHYWSYVLQYTAQTYRWQPQSGHKQSRNEEFSGEKSDISKCVPFYSHGWAHHVSEEEIQKAKKINTGCKKPKASRAVQCRILGYSTLYEVPDSTSSTVWFKNTFTCYNLESKKVMCRQDCLWICSTKTDR